MNVNQKRVIIYFGTVVSILVVAMFISIIPFTIADDNEVPPNTGSANTAILRPDGDVAADWNWYWNYYTRIDDPVVQPNAGDGLTMQSSTTGAYTIHSMTNFEIPAESVVTGITIWVRGRRTTTTADIPAVAYLIGMGASSSAILLPFGTTFEWLSATYTGLTLSQADVNDLQVIFTIETDSTGYPMIDVVYMVLTYGSLLPDTPVINQINYNIINETTEVQLDWNGVICESYNVYRSVNYGNYTLIEENVITTRYSDLLIEADAWLVSYRVSAVNIHGESGRSTPISINISPEGEPLADYTVLYALVGILMVLLGATVILLRMRKNDNNSKCR